MPFQGVPLAWRPQSLRAAGAAVVVAVTHGFRCALPMGIDPHSWHPRAAGSLTLVVIQGSTCILRGCGGFGLGCIPGLELLSPFGRLGDSVNVDASCLSPLEAFVALRRAVGAYVDRWRSASRPLLSLGPVTSARSLDWHV